MSTEGPKKPTTQDKRALLVKQKGIATGLNKRAKFVKHEGDRNLLNIDAVVGSAINYLLYLEAAFEKGEVNRGDVYKLLKKNLESGQSAEATEVISGRLFFSMSYYIKENEAHGKITGDVEARVISPLFVDTEVVDQLIGIMDKPKLTREEMNSFSENLANRIEDTAQWRLFWRERSEEANLEVVRERKNPQVTDTLKDRILSILMYKIIGESEAIARKRMESEGNTSQVRNKNMMNIKTFSKEIKGTFIPTPLEVEVQPSKVETTVVKSNQPKAETQATKPVTHAFAAPQKSVQDKVKFFEQKIKEQETKTPKGKPSPRRS